ncbi:chemotaxis protein CheC [Leeia sp. TBRC 13508]|uniref:Chemotaxis protein CheC n=1 Tax=Leeia speluncae TaxID=2884804 RepID=A0ABS8D742_9NEIS|nr:chemotaxis protein CheC [Leeia speluncae]MCB6183997.1 chemotaxis protein CheC [Leeia speluncae]
MTDSSQLLSSFSELQLDALAETFNLSLGEAAAVFSEMVSETIELSVPTVKILHRDELIAEVGHAGPVNSSGRLCGINQHFEAGELFSTDTMLVFPEKGSLEIVRRMLGDTTSVDQITELEQDALAEIGNIIINSCMSSLANLFHSTIEGTLPVVETNEAVTLFNNHIANDLILVAKIGMTMSTQDISGYMLFIMDVNSVKGFMLQVQKLFGIE